MDYYFHNLYMQWVKNVEQQQQKMEETSLKYFLDEKWSCWKEKGYVFFYFLKRTHIKLYHTNANWYIVVIKLCAHVHRTEKAGRAWKTEFDL